MTDYSNEMLAGQNYIAKTKYLFLVTINGIEKYLATKATRPTQTVAEMQLNFLNMKRWQGGKITWQPINVTITDAYTPSGAQQVMAWLRSKHQPLTGMDGWPTNYMKTMEIQLLGPDGSSQQKWTIYNAWVQNAEFGDLDMSDESTPVQINLTLRYDKAVLQY